MRAAVGRDQVRPMGRIVRIIAMLDNAGPVGIEAGRLIEAAADYGDADPATQLGRDLKHLRNQGWTIDNIAGQGEPARYRMVTGDNRLRLALSASQVTALQRAMILANRADLASRLGISEAEMPGGVGSAVVPHEASTELSLCLKAMRVRSRVRFSYKGTPRAVHPVAVRFQNGQWYLSGREDDGADHQNVLKHFVVGRMAGVALDPPESARAESESGRIPLHPLLWEVDPPVDVVLSTPSEFEPDVVHLLREPVERREVGDDVQLTYRVTHRAALRARIYALGERVQVMSPDDVRSELVAEIEAITG